MGVIKEKEYSGKLFRIEVIKQIMHKSKGFNLRVLKSQCSLVSNLLDQPIRCH